MVLDPIPQSLPVHIFGSRPQPPTSPSHVRCDMSLARLSSLVCLPCLSCLYASCLCDTTWDRNETCFVYMSILLHTRGSITRSMSAARGGFENVQWRGLWVLGWWSWWYWDDGIGDIGMMELVILGWWSLWYWDDEVGDFGVMQLVILGWWSRWDGVGDIEMMELVILGRWSGDIGMMQLVILGWCSSWYWDDGVGDIGMMELVILGWYTWSHPAGCVEMILKW